MLCPPRQIILLSACAILTCLVLRLEVVSSFPQPSVGTKKRWERIPVLQYHDEWVCVNKPPGLTVHRSRGTPKSRPVLTTTLKRQLSRKIFPIHRLDHRTSGAMLLTFNSEMAATLHDQAIRKGSKKYLALVRGFWTFDKEIVIDKPLTIKNVTREARTKFTCIATMDGEYDRSSLVLCEPLTGKTHQIRRHACSIGHPIIGDTEHGDTKINRWWRQERGLD